MTGRGSTRTRRLRQGLRVEFGHGQHVIAEVFLRNGLNLLGVSPYFFQIVIGVILLASTGITGLSQRRRRVAEQL